MLHNSHFDEDIKNLIVNKTGFDFTSFYLNKGTLPSKPLISPSEDSKMFILASQCMDKNLRTNSSSQDVLEELRGRLDALIENYK